MQSNIIEIWINLIYNLTRFLDFFFFSSFSRNLFLEKIFKFSSRKSNNLERTRNDRSLRLIVLYVTLIKSTRCDSIWGLILGKNWFANENKNFRSISYKEKKNSRFFLSLGYGNFFSNLFQNIERTRSTKLISIDISTHPTQMTTKFFSFCPWSRKYGKSELLLLYYLNFTCRFSRNETS